MLRCSYSDCKNHPIGGFQNMVYAGHDKGVDVHLPEHGLGGV